MKPKRVTLWASLYPFYQKFELLPTQLILFHNIILELLIKDMFKNLPSIIPISQSIRREERELFCLFQTGPIILLVGSLLQYLLVNSLDLLKLFFNCLLFFWGWFFPGLFFPTVIHFIYQNN